MKKRLFDRFDGKYLRKVDPFYRIIPYIMKTRVDSQVYYEDRINIDQTSIFLKELRNNRRIKIGYLHIIIAAMIRTIALKPRINRFISGRRIYARNDISISLAIKKSMSESVPETTIKFYFEPTDTIYDVVEKVNQSILDNKQALSMNDTDKIAKLVMFCPRMLIKMIISLVNFLDHHGKMPKFLNRLSPFHSSLFITDLGSLGIEPIYHHIYEFGTTSLFLAFGTKNKSISLNKDGEIAAQKFINIKVVADERICDGYYFSRSFQVFKSFVENPSALTLHPEEVYVDDEI